MAAVPCPFQPAIWPSSVAKMNRDAAGAAAPPCILESADEPLNTVPVGGPGTVTVRGTLALVVPLYRVDLLVPLSETHQGDVGLATIPQPFTRSVSWWSAAPATSENSR